jgi:DNA processing protein
MKGEYMTSEEYNYWLANIHNIGLKKIEYLLGYFENAKALFCAPISEVKNFIEGCSDQRLFRSADIGTIESSRDEEKVHNEYIRLIKKGISFVSKEDEHYPNKLRNIYEAPFALYVKGRLPEDGEKLLAVVGARDCSPYGKEMAKYFASETAKEGISIVSGLARGIDSYAHEGALISSGITYGILGCGIDICYPKENINLYMEMQRDGGIISEYAPGVKPIAGNFPMRNRIISGLCDGILVIEAREKSGSLITVDMGLEQGKDIYALPGRAGDRLSEGCNNLIKTGAKLVTEPKDILEDFVPDYELKNDAGKKINKILETDGKIVYACLSLEPTHIENISIRTGLPIDRLMEQLLVLELCGYIKQTSKNFYITTGCTDRYNTLDENT